MRHRVGALIDLVQRYKSHFSHFWAHRHEISLPNLRPHESEFLPAALSVQTKAVMPAGRWTGRILMLAFAFILCWSIFGRMDIVVNARGKIVPLQRTKTIDVLESAKVTRILVKEGQKVKEGDLLIELDTSTLLHERDKSVAERDAAMLTVARSRALIASLHANHFQAMEHVDGITRDRLLDARRYLESQWREYDAKRRRLNDEIERYSEQLAFISQRSKDYKELAHNRDVTVHAWLEKEQERAEIQGRLADARNQLAILGHELRKSAEDGLNEALRFLSTTRAEVARTIARSDLFTISSPINGFVHQLSAHTVGGTVTPSRPLMQIVPEDGQIEIEAFVQNKDIGFVRTGQMTRVKIDTFDYTKYGLVNGFIFQVSSDAIDSGSALAAHGDADTGKKGSGSGGGLSNSDSPMYSVKVRLDQSTMKIDGREVLLTAGMGADIEIKTGTRRIIEYVLSPLIKHTRESLNER